jgi:hypothetical protein
VNPDAGITHGSLSSQQVVSVADTGPAAPFALNANWPSPLTSVKGR